LSKLRYKATENQVKTACKLPKVYVTV
jgi:hypothetical protein